jgi:rhodanese-related sulfurtransferase
MKPISMTELHEKLHHLSSSEIILDVRTREEYAEGHVPGSKNIPHDEIENHVNELKKYECLYIHCRSGKRAQVAIGSLEKHGLKNWVCISSSGMQDWLAAGFPIEKGL